MQDDPRQQAARQVAREAMDLAEAQALPPIPVIFEVLFHHAGGNNPALSRNVDSALALPAEEREAAFQRIHADYLGADALRQALDRIRTGLASEIAEVMERLSDGMKGNLRMAGELRKTLRDLAGVITKDEMQALCKHMVLTGRSHLSDTQSVSQKLERVQYQLGEMHRELSILRETAQKDHLTGLPNRRHLEDRLAMMMEEGTQFCVAMIDLDNFKRINDSWGHTVGDNILRGAAQLLRQNVKGKDFAARYGGDEFVLLLPDTPLEGARKLCESIRHAFEDILWISQSSDQEIGSLTLSVGVTERAPEDDRATILARADDHLYDAKADGRNAVVCAA